MLVPVSDAPTPGREAPASLPERQVLRPRLEPPRRQVERLLGLGRARRPPRESVRRLIDEELAAAVGLIEPGAVIGSCPRGLSGSLFLTADMPLALVVLTVGPALDRRVEDLTRAGEVTRAMVLDAIGSAAAEELADVTNRYLCEQALARGWRPGRRRSPGYGGWTLEEQALIFARLRPEEIGVALGESFMMTPSKSISYALALDEPEAASTRGRCSRCGHEGCGFREEQA